jgi:hypothetical protein
MKYCPTCQTEYDEEILRFCTKDGTPLVEDSQPNFTELPSVSAGDEDDFGEETIVRQDKPAPIATTPAVTAPIDVDAPEIAADTAVEPIVEKESPRIVIATREEKRDQAVRPKQPAYYAPTAPPKSNTALIVVTTILLTLVVLGGVGLLFWSFNGSDKNANVNVNTNPPENLNLNVNSNVNIPAANFDYNTNTNYNLSTNIGSTNIGSTNIGTTNTNSNTKTPTPTRTPSPTPSPSPSASPTESPDATPRPTLAPTATRPPVATPTTRTPPSGAPAGSPAATDDN